MYIAQSQSASDTLTLTYCKRYKQLRSNRVLSVKMLNVKYESGKKSQTIFESNINLSLLEIWDILHSKGLSEEHFYVVHNGRIIQENDNIIGGYATVIPKLLGGKGGFGSMLRAIGAQIEKTTNREACRDLSGRRLRDINEEKRLKAWIEKQGSRDDEVAERKKKKLERLCAEPKHVFKDKRYEHERSVLTERIDDAVEQGFKNATALNSNADVKIDNTKKGKKRKTILDDIDSDVSNSSDSDESDIESPGKKLATDDNINRLSADEHSPNSHDQTDDEIKNTAGISNENLISCETILTVVKVDKTSDNKSIAL